MSTPAYSLSFNTKLTEDYVHLDSISASPVSTETPTPMAMFVNSNGQSEALIIDQNRGLSHLQREPLSSSGWNIYGIGALTASIAAASSGSVWIVGNDETLWQSNAAHWNSIPGLDTGMPELSVGLDGTVYAVGESTDGYHLLTFDAASGSFADQGVRPITSAPAGSPGQLWAINDSVVVMNGPDSWTQAPGSLPSPQQLCVGTDGSVWVLSSNGSVYSYDSAAQSWTELAGVPQGVAGLAVANAGLLYVQAGGQLQAYSSGNWSSLPNLPYQLVNNAISVAPDGTLWVLSAYGDTWRLANNAWVRQMTPTGLTGFVPGDVVEVATGQQLANTDIGQLQLQYAFYTVEDPANAPNVKLYCSTLNPSESFGGYWSDGVLLWEGQCSNLRAVFSPWDYRVVCYATIPNGQMLVVSIPDGETAWDAAITNLSKPASGPIQLTCVPLGLWYSFSNYNGILVLNVHVGKLDANPLFGNVPYKLATGNTMPTVASVVPFPLSWTSVHTCILDNQQQLYSVDFKEGFDGGTVTQLSGAASGAAIGPITSAVVIMTSESNISLFAQDNNNLLWILRATLVDHVVTWGQWHPLGDVCSFLANGPTGSTTPDLFMLDSGAEVAVLSEDAANNVWNELVMMTPVGASDDAAYVARYTTELTVTDQYSNPVPNYALSVTADEPTGIWIGTNLFNVGETIPSQIATNQMGQATFSIFADDLHVPTFTFAGNGLGGATTVDPAQPVRSYLAGTPGALPDKTDFDSAGTTLLAATMQPTANFTGAPGTQFVQSTQAQANAPLAAQAITSIAGIAPDNAGPAGQWSMSDSASTALGSSPFWHDLCSFGHDIDHAVKKGVMEVSKVTVDAEHGLVTLTMNIGDDLSQDLTLAVHTFQDMVSAVKSVFRFIERSVDEAIDWLKSLFSWSDILSTKRVIEAGLTAMMDRLETNFDSDPSNPYYIGKLFDQFFTEDLVGTIRNGFSEAMSHFQNPDGSKPTFAQQTPQTMPSSIAPAGSDPLHPDSVQGAQTSNGTHTNYMHNHVTNYTNGGGQLPTPTPSSSGGRDADGTFLQTLYDSITNNLLSNANFTPMETCTNIQANFFTNPKAFADVVMYDLINALQDAILGILDVVDEIFDALFAFAGDALAAFRVVMTTQIDIPVITWLWKQISGAPLTLLDLTSLMMAIPATILYKLTFGLIKSNPPTPFTSAQADAIVNQYSTSGMAWPDVAGGNASVTGAQSMVGSFPFPGAMQLIVLNGATYAIIDSLNDLLAHSLAENPGASDPAATWFSYCNITTGIIGQFLTAPYDIFSGSRTIAEQWTLGFWSVNFAPILSGLVFTFGTPVKAIARFNDAFGLPLNTLIAYLSFCLGVWTSMEQITDSTNEYGPCYWVQNVLAPIPGIFKPAVLVQGSPAGAIATGCLIACDVAMDGANFCLAIAEDAI